MPCAPPDGGTRRVFPVAPGEPGYLEVRRDFIPQVAAPFFWYDGGHLHRLHPIEQPYPRAFYLWDMAGLRGNVIMAVDKKFYFQVLNKPEEYPEYAPVPRIPETRLDLRGRSFRDPPCLLPTCLRDWWQLSDESVGSAHPAFLSLSHFALFASSIGTPVGVAR